MAQSKRARDDAMDAPEWWVEEARSAIRQSDLGLVDLGIRLAESIGRRVSGRLAPYSHSKISRFVNDERPTTTQEFAEALHRVLGVPRIMFTPQSVDEARALQAVADGFASSRRVNDRTPPSGLSVPQPSTMLSIRTKGTQIRAGAYSPPMKRPEGLVVEDLEAFVAAGRRLREVDEARFRKVLAYCRAVIANHDDELESDAVFASRLMEIRGSTSRGSA